MAKSNGLPHLYRTADNSAYAYSAKVIVIFNI